MDYVQQLRNTGTFNPSTGAVQTPVSPTDSLREIQSLRESFDLMKTKFERTLQLHNNKIYSLEKEVNELREELKQKTEVISKIRDQEVVQKSREALFSRKDRAPADKPIDRNNVAPADVQIMKVFNFSNKRF